MSTTSSGHPGGNADVMTNSASAVCIHRLDK